MKYLLDTNVIISLNRQGKISIINKLREVGIDECCITDITLYELYWGARLCKDSKQEISKVDIIARDIEIISTKGFVREASRQKLILKEKGQLIEDFDI